MTGRAMAQGVLVLAAAVALGWAVVSVGAAHAGGWIGSLLGAQRPPGDAPLRETLFTLIVFGPLVAIALIGGALERRNPFAPGRRPVGVLALGFLVGAAGLGCSAIDARLANVLTPGGARHGALLVLGWGLGVVVLQTAAEEIYFRGWLQPALVRRWGVLPAVLATALAFALLHVAGGARAPISLLNLFLGGLVFGVVAWRGGGLAGAVGVHCGWNATEQLVMGLDPNPGVGSFGAWWDHDLVGPAWWGGAADGLNGSVGMTATLLAILTPLLLRRGREAAWVEARGRVQRLAATAVPARELIRVR